jgi:hypothetical protein
LNASEHDGDEVEGGQDVDSDTAGVAEAVDDGVDGLALVSEKRLRSRKRRDDGEEAYA